MPTPQREPLRRLSRTERAVLQRIAKSSSERIDHVRRATALLAVARTGVFIHAAHEAGLRSGTTVADLVVRFNRHGLAAVHIASGRGRRATYTPALAHRSSPPRSANRTDARMVRRPGRSPRCSGAAASGLAAGGHQHDSARAAGCGQFVPADADLVSDWHGPAQAQSLAW